MGVVYQPSEEVLQIMHVYDLQYVDLETNGGTFEEGEWVGEDANGGAIKFDGTNTIARPKLVLTGTERNDVKESGKITTARGKFRFKTKIYKAAQTWNVGDKVIVVSDNGKGVLAPLPTAAGTYVAIGEVVTPPSVDGEYLIVDRFADDKEITV